jgi:hypothetical protein
VFKTHGSLMADKHKYAEDPTDSRVWMNFTVKLDSLQFCIEAIRPPFILPSMFDITVCSFDELRVTNFSSLKLFGTSGFSY